MFTDTNINAPGGSGYQRITQAAAAIAEITAGQDSARDEQDFIWAGNTDGGGTLRRYRWLTSFNASGLAAVHRLSIATVTPENRLTEEVFSVVGANRTVPEEERIILYEGPATVLSVSQEVRRIAFAVEAEIMLAALQERLDQRTVE